MNPAGLTPTAAAAYIGCSLRHFELHHAPHLPYSDLAAPGARKRMPRYRPPDLELYLQRLQVAPQ